MHGCSSGTGGHPGRPLKLCLSNNFFSSENEQTMPGNASLLT